MGFGMVSGDRALQNLLGKVREVGSTAGERAGELSGDVRAVLDRHGEEAARRFREVEEALAKQAAELRVRVTPHSKYKHADPCATSSGLWQ